MKKSVVKIRSSAKVAVITIPSQLLQESGLEVGDIIIMGATHGRIAITPVDTSGIEDVLGGGTASPDDWEDEVPPQLLQEPPAELAAATRKNGKHKKGD